jgi:hypothetical protein
MRRFASLLIAVISTLLSIAVVGQEPAGAPETGWRPSPNSAQPSSADPRYAMASAPAADAQPITPTPGGEPITRAQVSKGSGALPNDHGQVWREYDITPYTVRIDSTQHPEQTIVDWILRETGYEAWHSTPVGLLSADRKVLRVYHTPQMQAIVAEIVDRFVSTRAQSHGFGLRIITMKNPNWRTRAIGMMTAIPVQSPGVQAWIMAREDAAVLRGDLKRRTDYREHNTPHQMVLNGQTAAISTMRPRTYAKGIIPTQTTWPGYQPETGQLEEGFALEFSPLLSTDATTTDAVIKLRLAQVERMLPVKVEVSSAVAPNQQAEIEVPQLTMLQLHERFRWPTDQVLLLSMGVVATPGPDKSNPIVDILPMGKSAPRADALLMIESTGTVSQSAPAAAPGGGGAVETASRIDRTFHGRY